MRPIRKGTEPAELTQWKALASADWQPTYENLRSPQKPAVVQALLKEQGFICCYCEQRVSGSADSHIEHLVPQSVDPRRTLDFGNMLCSCQGEPPPEPSHCGHLRKNSPLPVHPLMADCREHFEFDSAGRIHPSPEPGRAVAAQDVIRLLGLDIPKLVRRRQAAIEGLFEELDGQAVDFKALEALKDSPDADGRLLPFCSALVAVLRSYTP